MSGSAFHVSFFFLLLKAEQAVLQTRTKNGIRDCDIQNHAIIEEALKMKGNLDATHRLISIKPDLNSDVRVQVIVGVSTERNGQRKIGGGVKIEVGRRQMLEVP
jgi:hypothetical protein